MCSTLEYARDSRGFLYFYRRLSCDFLHRSPAPNKLIRSSGLASSSSAKPLSSKPVFPTLSIFAAFVLLPSELPAASVEGVGSLPASTPRPKRALNPANRPASSCLVLLHV